MYTTQLDNGTLNIYATEPKVYFAEYPALYQQRRYLFQGAHRVHEVRRRLADLFEIATLLVAATILVALAVS